MPPIQVRVRGRRLQALAARIARLADPREFDPSSGDSPRCGQTALEFAGLVALLVRVVTQLQVELAELDSTVATHVEAYARAPSPAARRLRLEQMIDETAASPAAARADRRALDRHLDLDALRERYDLRRERLVVEIELGVMALGPSVALALDGSEPTNEARSLIIQAQPIAFLRDQLLLLRRWPSRLACVESLEATLSTLDIASIPAGHRSESPPYDVAALREQLLALGRDRGDHEWVQARAIACLRLVDVEACRALIRERLGLVGDPEPRWPSRDFLVRRLLIAQLCDHIDDPVDALTLTQALARGDPSEFVRIAHAKTLEVLAPARPELFAIWGPHLTRIADEADEAERPRVRATACINLVVGLDRAIVSGRVRPEKLDELARIIVDSLSRTITRDRAVLVARIACEQAPALCERVARTDPDRGLLDSLPELGERLIAALHECLADDDHSPAIHDAAAAAIEAVDEALRADRARWTAALREAVAEVPPGGRRRIELPTHEGARPSEVELSRILATITRNDWGVDVDRRGDRLLVRRGDHRTTRLWRILHELRHPAGNKRQAFRHTTGRRYAGRLRAHPSRLDEVTATVVPGERLHIEAEGGWGRHLPTVDDVLGLPWLRGSESAAREVVIASSHGLTRLRVHGRLAQRLRARMRLNLDYAELSELRRRALMADESSERRRYADELRTRYGVELWFEPHPSSHGQRPVPARLRALFPSPRLALARAPTQPELDRERELELPEGRDAPDAQPSAALVPVALADPNFGEGARAWFRSNLHYFLTLEGNSQEALGLFALGLASLFLGSGYLRRRRIASARAAIPLSIGGWGTRGKSGTERLKAGLFHGLGFRTFSKTTGCEAMFIHAAPLGPQVEIFTFRPYNKATIWEQRDLLQLAAALESEVFLWECMALNPEYVDILQRGWMRDDFATITNTYPDHEDIQGPAGIDVANVIARFIPDGRPVISSELAFNPVLRLRAAERGAELLEIGDYEGDLLADDLLALFPYSEHPRNIALVTELARQLGIDDELAIVTMADYVYPDLGVLKFYPEVTVRGRRLAFVNGCSANERAGFLNNWKRTGCDRLAAAGDPERMVITVVNNRDDRVSRSEVFSRILVNDVSVDAHVLIGTNLAGLAIFIDRALETFAGEQELVDAEALAAGGPGHERARKRLRALLRRVRAPVDDWRAQLETLLRLGLAALGRRFDPDAPAARTLVDHVAALRGADGPLEFDAALAKLAGDHGLSRALRELHDRAEEDANLRMRHEVGHSPDFDDCCDHLRDRIARIIIAARLAHSLESVLDGRDLAGLTRFTQTLTRAWTALFKAQIIIVADAGATGDQIIDQCARAVPPGVHVTIMGTQNIKGTGLDFIYRWLAVDAVHTGLARLESADEHARLEALRNLDAHSDFGVCDTGLLVARLPEFTDGGSQEASLRDALLSKASAIHQDKLRKLESSTGAAAKGGRLWRAIEEWVDFIDGALRYRQSQQLVQDLIDFRLSHNKMAVEMREIYARAKGGWLAKALAGLRVRRPRT